MNDMRIDRQASDQATLCASFARQTILRAILVGTVAALLSSPSPVDAQDKRLARASMNQPNSYPNAPLVANDYGYDEPGYYGGGGGGGLPADCGLGCPPTWRVRAEILELNREGDGNASLSTGGRLGEFDYTEGGRITLNRKLDCSLGWELVYTGFFDWEETNTVNGAANLNTTLVPDVGINLSAFNGANQHQQLYRSRLQSIEVNEKWWGWDVFTSSAGVRMINIDEDFSFLSVDANGDLGVFSHEINNNIIGPQLGMDMLFPVGRFSVDGMLKGALCVNIGESSTFLRNAGVVQVNTTSDDVEFAALIEYGTYVRYSFTPRINVRAGYELLWIYGLGIAVEQIRNPIGPLSGTSFNAKGDTFYHGATLGVEVVF